jgi:glycosyltransferase involved in cell wall biosynthesis
MHALLTMIATRKHAEAPLSSPETYASLEPVATSVDVGGENRPAVSVIIPVRNEAATIERLITILQKQTYQPAEIVIADGGSTDGTQAIIRRLQASSTVPIVLVEDRNAFPGRGRNLAIGQAVNPWLACVDAGILPEENWLEELVRAWAANPGKHLIQGRYQRTISPSVPQLLMWLPGKQKCLQSLPVCFIGRPGKRSAAFQRNYAQVRT